MWSGVAPDGVEPRELAWELLRRRLRARARARGAARGHARLRARAGDARRAARRLRGARRAARRTRRALGLTLDIGHSSASSRVGRRSASGAARRRSSHVHIEDMRRGVHEHLMFGDGELDLDGALAALHGDRLRAAWSPSSCRATRTPPTRRSRARSRCCARPRTRGGGDVSDPTELSAALDERARPDGLAWLREASAAVAADPAAIRVALPDGRAARSAASRCDPDADPADVHAWTIDDAARTLLLVALGDARRGRARPSSTATATPPSGAASCARCRTCPSATARLRPRRRRDPHQRHAADRRRARAVRDRAPARRAPTTRPCSSASSSACRSPRSTGSPTRVTPDGARMLAAFVHERVAAGRDVPAEVWTVIDRYPPAEEIAAIEAELRQRVRRPPRGRRARAEPSASRRSQHEDLRPARAHDVAHHRRLRGDGRLRREGARRAGVLARPAAHVGRLVRRLLQLAARLGALPRRAVRHPPPLHDRPQPEGGQRRRAAARGARRCCRASSPRTASSRSARSASTR